MTARDDLHALASADAEVALLGGLLLDNRAWDRVGGDLKAEHFSVPLHRAVFAELARQIEAGQQADVITVSDALGQRATITEVNSLAQFVPGAGSAARYAAIIVDRFRARELLAASSEIADLARDADRPIVERIDAAQARLSALTADAPRDDWSGAYEGMVEHTAVLEARAEGKIVAFPTGLGALDEQLDGGPRPGQLVVLAARPAMGKSAFGQSVGLNMAAERPVGFISMEMSHTDVRDRMVAMLGRVSLSSVLRPSRGEGLTWDRVLDGTERAKALRFFVSDQSGLNIRQVKAKARALKRLRGLEVLVVDYIGLMNGLDPRQPRVYQIEEISRGLKGLAKELGIAVIALAQLNRDVEKRADPTPMLSDLRDSGAIEQDADIVLMLHRPIASNPDLGAEWHDYAKLRIAKVRQGRTGDVHLRYVGDQVRFEDWAGLIPKRGGKTASNGGDL